MIFVKTLFDNLWVLAGQTALSDVIKLDEWVKPVGWKGSLMLTAMLGAGTAKVSPLYSLDGKTFLTPTGVTDIKADHLASSGPESDGVDIYEFTLFTAPYMKIAVQECNGESAVAIEAMSQENPCKITVTGHGLSTGAYVQINGVTQEDWAACSGQVLPITKVDNDNFTIAFDASEFGTAYNAGTDDGTINTIPIRISALLAIR